jgi:hypothetical protein
VTGSVNADPIVQQPAAQLENPMAAAGRQKVELGTMPTLPMLYQAAVHDLGADKYGPFNWREKPIPIRDYISAIQRHLALSSAGENLDDESGLPHLAHMMANCAIMIDADAAGTLNDDRRTTPSLASEMKRIAELKKSWPKMAA